MFEDGQWVKVPPEGMSKMPKIEGQVWIAIYNLFLSPECASKYEITDYRKNMILRLRKYMNELVLDQIPNLVDLLKTLEQMSIMNTNAQSTSNPFVVQQMPEIRTKILEDKDWKEIARYQLEHHFTKVAENQEFDIMVKFADMYSSQNAEILTRRVPSVLTASSQPLSGVLDARPFGTAAESARLITSRKNTRLSAKYSLRNSQTSLTRLLVCSRREILCWRRRQPVETSLSRRLARRLLQIPRRSLRNS
eukprot:GABU01004678.1.p1 GENE.GABU01004678.1~~GABU01004678.1.p1  ORF type:complete len:263 (-),score=60.81 GABU01004678.1:39-788(-)